MRCRGLNSDVGQVWSVMVHCPAFAMRAVGTESIWRHGPLHAHCDARRLQRSALLRCDAGIAGASSGTRGEIPAWAVHSNDQGARFVHWGGTDRGGRPGNRCFPWRNTNTSKRYARARGPRALQQTQPLQHSRTYKHNRTPTLNRTQSTLLQTLKAVLVVPILGLVQLALFEFAQLHRGDEAVSQLVTSSHQFQARGAALDACECSTLDLPPAWCVPCVTVVLTIPPSYVCSP